jgi:hypothetical protein
LSKLRLKCEHFISHVHRFRKCCARIEARQVRLRVTDVELVYSSSFLSVSAQWEGLLEEILLEAVCGEKSMKRHNRRIVEVKSRTQLLNLLLFGGKKYLAIGNLKQAEEAASLFLVGGTPFSAVAEHNRTHIQQAAWIRNAIAHRSRHAMEKFRQGVPGVEALSASKRFPGPFLRHVFRVAPVQRRYEIYFWAYQTAAKEMADAW